MKRTILYMLMLVMIVGTAAALPAPMTFYFSDTNPAPGDSLTYTYRMDAEPMDSSYRTMIHFVDDAENIILNDDHWLLEEKGYNTDSSSFYGYHEYPRTLQLPSDFEGQLRIITGMYPWDGITAGPTVALDPSYVTDFGYNRYLVGTINVQQPKTAPRASSISDTTPAQGQTITYTLSYDAVPMDQSYRTFVHFIDDSGNIMINDDHWISEEKGFSTDSGSFNGYVS
ncbi:hypothetical protein GF345_04305, partial [Candidatus Woesearchaeota archaeon]|nr:hypothetical protein [Candidatus Woesearchaeota archaeon]